MSEKCSQFHSSDANQTRIENCESTALIACVLVSVIVALNVCVFPSADKDEIKKTEFPTDVESIQPPNWQSKSLRYAQIYVQNIFQKEKLYTKLIGRVFIKRCERKIHISTQGTNWEQKDSATAHEGP